MIPEDVIAEIRSRVDIVAVIGQHVQLRKAGRNWKGLCPFHGEKTPSFNVAPDKGFFFCFGCQKKGDAFTFVMELEGKSFTEAAEQLAARAGIVITRQDESPEQRRARGERSAMLDVCKAAAEVFRENLRDAKRGATGRAYLETRGVGDAISERFMLGFAMPEWSNMHDALRTRRMDLELALKLGLIARRPNSSGYYDRFRDRLVCPVIVPGGDVVGFSARTLPSNAPPDPRGEAPKYINSPESLVYKKSRLLFGLSQARDSMAQKGRAVLVEGNFDVITFHQAGIGEAVAPLGTALTAEQVETLRRQSAEVVICYDGDRAGRSATRAALELLVAADIAVRVVALPDGEDPDSLVRNHGPAKALEMVTRAVGGIEYFCFEVWGKANGSADSHTRALDDAARLITKVANPTKRDLIVGTLASAMKLDVQVVHKAVERQERSGSGRSDGGSNSGGWQGAPRDRWQGQGSSRDGGSFRSGNGNGNGYGYGNGASGGRQGSSRDGGSFRNGSAQGDRQGQGGSRWQGSRQGQGQGGDRWQGSRGQGQGEGGNRWQGGRGQGNSSDRWRDSRTMGEEPFRDALAGLTARDGGSGRNSYRPGGSGTIDLGANPGPGPGFPPAGVAGGYAGGDDGGYRGYEEEDGSRGYEEEMGQAAGPHPNAPSGASAGGDIPVWSPSTGGGHGNAPDGFEDAPRPSTTGQGPRPEQAQGQPSVSRAASPGGQGQNGQPGQSGQGGRVAPRGGQGPAAPGASTAPPSPPNASTVPNAPTAAPPPNAPRQGGSQAAGRPGPQGNAPSRKPSPPPIEEVELLALLSDHPALLATADADKAFSLLTDGRLRDMYSAARQGQSMLELVHAHLPQPTADLVLSGKYADAIDPGARLAVLSDHLVRRAADVGLRSLGQRLAEAKRSGDHELERKLVAEILSTRKQVD